MPLFAEEWRRFVDLVQNRTAFDNLPDPRRTPIHDNRSRASGAKIEDAECYVEGDEADSDEEGEVIHVDVVVELLYTRGGPVWIVSGDGDSASSDDTFGAE